MFFERLPGYGLLRSLTQRLAGDGEESAWQPALVEIEDALVPGFIIEELGDGRFTVFVPSVPTPLAGAVYILARERVHPLDVPFTQAIQIDLPMGRRARVSSWPRCETAHRNRQARCCGCRGRRAARRMERQCERATRDMGSNTEQQRARREREMKATWLAVMLVGAALTCAPN